MPAIARRRAVERDGERRRGRRARASIAGVTLGGVARDSREGIARAVDEGIERSMRRMQTKCSRRARVVSRARGMRAMRRRDACSIAFGSPKAGEPGATRGRADERERRGDARRERTWKI